MARLLLIDDDDLVAATLRRHLERVGHEVVSVRHGGFGLKAFETQPFDMVITDILMPEIEGIETIRTLRRHDKTVPIVAITGGPVQNPVGASSGHDYLEMARLLGATRTLKKPFTGAELLQVVSECLSSK